MATLPAHFRSLTRALVASGAAALVLLQLLTTLLVGGASAHARDVEAAVASAAAPVCRAAWSGGGHGPTQGDGLRHCSVCILGCDAPQADAAALVAMVAEPPSARADAILPALGREVTAAAGWRSSWSSRAPPCG